MTFQYTDPDGDHLYVTPTTRYGKPALNLRTERRDGESGAAVDIPASQLEDVVDGLRRIRRQAAGGHPGIRPLQPKPEPTTPALSEQIAGAIHADLLAHRGRLDQGLLGIVPRLTDAVLAVILPTTRLTADLHRSAEADLRRVTTLYEQWVKAGPPAAGTSISRWWDARLVELRTAILPPTEH